MPTKFYDVRQYMRELDVVISIDKQCMCSRSLSSAICRRSRVMQNPSGYRLAASCRFRGEFVPGIDAP